MVLTLLLCADVAGAAGLGLVTAHGSVKVNGFRAWDNASVWEGVVIETDKVGARITLNTGAEILLGPATRIRFEKGVARLEAGSSVTRGPGSAAVFEGPNAAAIPGLLDTLIETRPLSQRP